MSFGTRLLAVLALALASVTAAAAPEPLVLGIHPYLPAAELQRRFAPLAAELGRAAGRPVTVRVGRNYAEHVEAAGMDALDVAYMGPVPYVRMVERHGRKPLLARQEVDGQPWLRGEIVVRSDSPIASLAQLRGKRFAFGDPESTMSHVVPARMLGAAGVPERDLAHVGFLGAHRNVALAVLAGDYDAGAIKDEVFREYAPRGLRSIATSPRVPDHLFVVSARLAPDLVDTLRAALLALGDSARGRAILEAVHPGMSALAPVRDSDYDALRALIR